MKARTEILDVVYAYLKNRKPPHEYSGNVFASEVAHCERKIGYRLAQIPETNPMPDSSQWNFFIGDIAHDAVQDALTTELEGTGVAERRWVMQGVSGRADFYHPEGAGGVEEYKTVHRFQFQKKEPRWEDVWQGEMSGLALKARGLRVGYICKDTNYGEDPFKEWIFEVDVARAQANMDRLEGIRRQVTAGMLPARVVPRSNSRLTIPDPMNPPKDPDTAGEKRGARAIWVCRYCNWRDECSRRGTEALPLAEVQGATGKFNLTP